MDALRPATDFGRNEPLRERREGSGVRRFHEYRGLRHAVRKYRRLLQHELPLERLRRRYQDHQGRRQVFLVFHSADCGVSELNESPRHSGGFV